MIFVGSLKYSPVYKSHCCAFGEACEESGYKIKYLFSREYEWMLSKEIKEKTIFIGNSTSIKSMLKDTINLKNILLINEIIMKYKPTHIYLHNYHFLNHFISGLFKNSKYKFIYHVHEPYTENKSAHGGTQQYWLYLNEFMEAKLIHDTNIAVVSSKEGSRLFDKTYPWFKGEKVEIPLLYEDLGKEVDFTTQHNYITFIGPPVPAKGPDIFLKIVDYAAEHNLGWSFLLVSREKITDPRFLNKSNLSIFHKERISDEEFGSLIRNSFVVITPYKRETQSSVILVSHMYGTPVVSSNVGGLPEFVNHGKTGYLVNVNAPVENWIEGINYIVNNLSTMTVNCRNYFVENFSGKNWKKYINNILS